MDSDLFNMDIKDEIDSSAATKEEFLELSRDERCFFFTVSVDKKPMMLVGFIPLREGVASLSSFVDKEIRSEDISGAFIRAVHVILDDLHRAFNIRRFQMLVDDGFVEAERFAEFLGFQCEGIMKQFGPNREDVGIWGRVY